MNQLKFHPHRYCLHRRRWLVLTHPDLLDCGLHDYLKDLESSHRGEIKYFPWVKSYNAFHFEKFLSCESPVDF